MLPFASLLLAAAVAQPSPVDVLRAAIAAPKHLSYVGEVQVVHFGSTGSEAAIYRIEHRAPNLTRRWYVAPQDLYGDSIISRAEKTYSIDVKRNRVVQAEDDSIDDQVAEDDNFAVLMSNYNATFAPNDNVAGQNARVVLLTNKYTGQVTMRIKIDAHTGLVLEKEVYAANGSLAGQTHFDQIRYTSTIPPAVFDVPKGLQVVDGPTRSLPSNNIEGLIKEAGFAARGPKYLPEGFTPVEGDVSLVKGVRTLHLLYSDGIRTVSLFQNPGNSAVGFSSLHPRATKVGSHAAQYVAEGPTTLLAWSEGGLHFTLVGDLYLADLEKIAASVGP